MRAVNEIEAVLYDAEVERRVLAAIMATPDVVWPAVEGAVRPQDFYTVRHGHIYAAIESLCARGQNPWEHHVIDELRRSEILEAAGGRDAVTTIAESYQPGSAKAAADDARLVASFARARAFGTYAEQLRLAAARNDAPAALRILREATEATAHAEAAPTWAPVDVEAVLAGGIVPVVPMQLAREDGECLLYPGKVHAFNAEPESGKSWLAMAACRETLAAGDHVLYLDFEADVESVLERMSALGAAPRALGERFHYVRPDDPFDVAARARLSEVLTTHNPALAVIDGVAEVMALNGWDENANADIAAFLNALPRLLERQGCTVVLIDHVVKDSKTRGRYARGGAHKLAGISGATYRLEAVRPFARGQVGMAKVIVTKDRPGWVRRLAVGDKVAEFELASSDDGESVTVTLRGPQSALGSDGEFRPTGYMERVSRELETASAPLSGSAVRRFVAGKKPVIDAALRCLVAEGYAAAEPGPRNAQLHRSVRPFREDAEAVENESEMDEEPF